VRACAVVQTQRVSGDQRPLDLGMALRALRRHGDLSQRQLAQRAGVPVSTVARIESGEIADPRIRTVERLARAAGGAVWMGVEPHRPVEPIPHERQIDAADRHYPAHLDVRLTFPYVGRDRRILPAGTAVHHYHQDRGKRDADRARAAEAAALPIESFDRTGGGSWLWVASTDSGEVAGRLSAVVLAPAPTERRTAVLCGLDVMPAWRESTLEQRLLGRLREAVAGLGPTELVTLTYGGMEVDYLKALGFHSRSTTVFVLAGRP
jgi:transcriptional regulator with XRE-family HTH domain